MENLPSLLDEQRAAVMDQARAGLVVLFSHLNNLPEEDRDSNYTSIAWSAVGEGLWKTFAEYYDGDEACFIASKPDMTKHWVLQFAQGGDFNTAKSLAGTIVSREVQRNAYSSIAYKAAECGDVALTLELSELAEDDKDKDLRSRVLSNLFCTLTAQARWAEADELMKIGVAIETSRLLSAADNAAKQGEFERFVLLANQAIKQNPIVHKGRGDPDEGDWLRRPVKQAARTAFIKGNYGFFVTIRNDVEWPEDANEHWQDWVTNGVINGIYESKNFDAGIGMFIAKAIDAGEDRELYDRVQSALEVRNWTAIELLATNINSEILGMLHRLAHKEGQLEAAKFFTNAMNHKDNYEGNYLFLSDDTAPTMIDEAKNGNWETALELRNSTLRIFAYANAEELIKIAIAQERYDILLDLIGKDDSLLSSARAKLENRGLFQLGEKLADEWLSYNPGIVEPENLHWFQIDHLNHTAPAAAEFGDWQRALLALEKMDKLTQRDNCRHRGYEFVATEALRILSFEAL